MTDSKLIDSSLWIDFLINGKYKELIEENEIFLISSISLLEIKKKLLKLKYASEDVIKSLNYVKEKSNCIDVTKEIAENAANVSVNHDLGAVDAIIYATAMKHDTTLITLDNDFRNLKNAQVLD